MQVIFMETGKSKMQVIDESGKFKNAGQIKNFDK